MLWHAFNNGIAAFAFEDAEAMSDLDVGGWTADARDRALSALALAPRPPAPGRLAGNPVLPSFAMTAPRVSDQRLAAAPAPTLVVEPFLHVSPTRIENPLRDRAIAAGDPGFAELLDLLRGELEVDRLPAPPGARSPPIGWLVENGPHLATRFRLKYVSLEAHTVCNQSCYFCPVSIAPREDYFMPTELYERIVGELPACRDTIEAVFMINYNEPTVDKRFVEQVRAIREAGLPPAVLTNGTGLTPAGSTRWWPWAACASSRSTSRRSTASATPRSAAATISSWCCATSTTRRTSRWPSGWTWSSSAPATRPQARLRRDLARASPAAGSTSSTTR